MTSEVLGLGDDGHGVVQNSSTSQLTSQIPLATVMSTVGIDDIKGGFFDEIVLFFEKVSKVH